MADNISLAEDRIEGRNPVFEALKSGRRIDKLFIQRDLNDGSLVKIRAIAREKGIVVSDAAKQKLDAMSHTGSHQGVIAYTAMHEYCEIDDILELARERGEAPLIVIADEISDPHNLGSIIRTADAAGVHGVIIPKRRAVGLSAVVAKASAGALEYVPVCKVGNISAAIEELKKKGLWVAGAAMEGESVYGKADLTGPLALVIGSEGSGISRLVKEKCDFLVSIPMYGSINSLNASVAAGVLMLEVARQRRR